MKDGVVERRVNLGLIVFNDKLDNPSENADMSNEKG
jgi:hypothetical protein